MSRWKGHPLQLKRSPGQENSKMSDAQESKRHCDVGTEMKTEWIMNRTPYAREDAVQAFQKAIDLHPQNLLAYHRLAFELRHLDRFEEAEESVRCGLEAGEWPAELDQLYSVSWDTEEIHQELWNELGLIFADQSKFDKASEAFSQAAKLRANVGKGPDSEKCLNEVRSGTYRREDYRLSMGAKVGKKGCFVATAAIGSEDAPELIVLTRFRDEVLDRAALGRLFVRGYYRVSPHLVKVIEHHWFVRRAVRLTLILPLVGIAQSVLRIRRLRSRT